MASKSAVREWFLRFEYASIARRGRLHGPLSRLKAPMRAAREAHGAVSSHGRLMQAPDRPSASRLRWRLFRLNLARRVDAEAFYIFALHRPDRWSRRSLYVSRVEGTIASRLAVYLLHEKQFRILRDKRSFDEWSSQGGLPTVRTLGVAAEGELTWCAQEGCAVPEQDLFVKDARGYGGANTMQALWRDGVFECSDGRTRSAAELGRTLQERSFNVPVLVQPLMVNHPLIRRLSVRALNTVRVSTCLSGNGQVTPIAAALRLARGNATADNIVQGGLAAGVDLDTGRLGSAVLMDKRFDEYHFTHHPDTGALIAGTEVPYWNQVTDLATRAHARLGGIPCAAWDIAVLEDGPILVEGNWNGDTWLPQVPADTPLLTTIYDDVYADPLASLVDGLTDEELISFAGADPRVAIG
jgi:hypothetical protein